MTCVTLKRPIEVLGSPHMMEHEPMAKRKRCGASFFPTTPPGSRFGRGGLSSPSSPYSGSLGGAMSRSTKRAKRRLEIDDRDSLPGANSPPPVSSFLNATPVLSPGKFVIRHLVHNSVLGREILVVQVYILHNETGSICITMVLDRICGLRICYEWIIQF